MRYIEVKDITYAVQWTKELAKDPLLWPRWLYQHSSTELEAFDPEIGDWFVFCDEKLYTYSDHIFRQRFVRYEGGL